MFNPYDPGLIEIIMKAAQQSRKCHNGAMYTSTQKIIDICPNFINHISETYGAPHEKVEQIIWIYFIDGKIQDPTSREYAEWLLKTYMSKIHASETRFLLDLKITPENTLTANIEEFTRQCMEFETFGKDAFYRMENAIKILRSMSRKHDLGPNAELLDKSSERFAEGVARTIETHNSINRYLCSPDASLICMANLTENKPQDFITYGLPKYWLALLYVNTKIPCCSESIAKIFAKENHNLEALSSLDILDPNIRIDNKIYDKIFAITIDGRTILHKYGIMMHTFQSTTKMTELDKYCQTLFTEFYHTLTEVELGTIGALHAHSKLMLQLFHCHIFKDGNDRTWHVVFITTLQHAGFRPILRRDFKSSVPSLFFTEEQLTHQTICEMQVTNHLMSECGKLTPIDFVKTQSQLREMWRLPEITLRQEHIDALHKIAEDNAEEDKTTCYTCGIYERGSKKELGDKKIPVITVSKKGKEQMTQYWRDHMHNPEEEKEFKKLMETVDIRKFALQGEPMEKMRQLQTQERDKIKASKDDKEVDASATLSNPKHNKHKDQQNEKTPDKL